MVYIFLPLSYFIGSFSPAFYIVKWKINESVFNLGSGNAGAANVMNILGKKWGTLVGIMDFSKGIAVVHLGQILGLNMTSYVFLSGLVFCICGHNWSFFLGFKGGMGLATSIGILMMFNPICLLFSLVGGFIFRFFLPMELAVFFGGSIYVILNLFLEKNLWAGFLPLFLGIPIILKRIYWRKMHLRKTEDNYQ